MADFLKAQSDEQSDEPLLDLEAGADLSEPVAAYSLECIWSEVV